MPRPYLPQSALGFMPSLLSLCGHSDKREYFSGTAAIVKPKICFVNKKANLNFKLLHRLKCSLDVNRHESKKSRGFCKFNGLVACNSFFVGNSLSNSIKEIN